MRLFTRFLALSLGFCSLGLAVTFSEPTMKAPVTFKQTFLPVPKNFKRAYVLDMNSRGDVLIGAHAVFGGPGPGTVLLWNGKSMQTLALPGGIRPQELRGCLSSNGKVFLITQQPAGAFTFDGKAVKAVKVPSEASAAYPNDCQDDLTTLLTLDGEEKVSYLWSPTKPVTKLDFVPSDLNAKGELIDPERGVRRGNQWTMPKSKDWLPQSFLPDGSVLGAYKSDTLDTFAVWKGQAPVVVKPPKGQNFAVLYNVNRQNMALVIGDQSAPYLYDLTKGTYTPVQSKAITNEIYLHGVTDTGNIVGHGDAGVFLLSPVK